MKSECPASRKAGRSCESSAKGLANIPANKEVHRVILPVPRNFFQQIFSGDDEDDASVKAELQQRAALDALPEDLRRAFRYAHVLDHMQRGEVMLMMPFDLRIK
jgi:hypothetical protein